MSNVTDSASQSGHHGGAMTHHQHHQSTNASPVNDRELIKTFWSNFVRCSDDKDKVKWLDLFIAEFNRLISSDAVSSAELNSEKYRVMAPAASQLTCYLLQLVHEIVCASIGDTQSPSSDASPIAFAAPAASVAAVVHKRQRQSSSVRSSVASSSSANRFSPNIAMINADITTIVALREFLMYGVGGRMLEALLLIDTKNMLCARELTGLLINLFPTNHWDPIDQPGDIKEVMDDLEPPQVSLTRLEAAIRQRLRRKTRKPPTTTIARGADTIDSHDATDDATDWRSFALPASRQLTVDYIGSLVLNLIHKLVREDVATHLATNTFVDAGSVTVQCLHFAIDAHRTMDTTTAFKPDNNVILSRRLLAIISRALVGVFAKPTIGLGAICSICDLCYLVQGMLTTVERQFTATEATENRDDYVGVGMLLVLILQRCASQRATLVDDDGTADGLAQRLVNVLNDHREVIVRLLLQIERADGGSFVKCLTILQRIIQSLSQFEPATSVPPSHSHRRRSRNGPAVSRKRSHPSSLNTCGGHRHHLAYLRRTLSCVLEHIVLQVAGLASGAPHLRLIHRHFQLNAQCCCNTQTAAELEQLLRNARATGTLPHCLQYMRNNILRPTFGGHAHHQSQLPVGCIACEPCEKRRFTFATDGVFVQLYADLAATSTTVELPLLLRHLAKVAKYLPFDTACRVMAEVLLPQFRQHKAAGSAIVSLCLNAFLCYLRDIRLIKAFFNDDNIQHLADLMALPSLASLVCCLVRIGVDNASFLGENCGEQTVLAERLRLLQSDAVHGVTDTMAAMFRAVSSGAGGCGIVLVRMNVLTEATETRNALMGRLEARELSVTEVLQLAVVYWNQMLQTLRRHATQSDTVPSFGFTDRSVLAAMMQNTLSCFLYSRPIFVDEHNDCSTISSFAVNGFNDAQRFVWVSLDHRLDDAELDRAPFRSPIYTRSGDGVDSVDGERRPYDLWRDHSVVSLRASSELIYDLRLAKSEQLTSIAAMDTKSVVYASFSVEHASSVDLTRFTGLRIGGEAVADAATAADDVLKDDEDAHAETISSPAINSVVQNVFQYISDNVWDMLFPANAVRSQAAELADEQRQLERVFGSGAERVQIVESPENKRLFLQLFEIACGVLMCDGVFEVAATSGDGNDGDGGATTTQHHRKMSGDLAAAATGRSRALQQLKIILLRHSEHIHGSAANGAAIVSALQSLLKCAEMRYRCCMVDDCDHASYAQASAAGDDALMSTVTTTALKGNGGDNLCCAATANGFDGGGDAQRTVAGHGSSGGGVGSEDGGARGSVVMVDSYSSDADVTDAEGDDEDRLHGTVNRASSRSTERGSSDDSYLTADEGYDGDAELAASLDSDNDLHYGRSDCDAAASAATAAVSLPVDNGDDILPVASHLPASRYRQPIIHTDICRIVVDILIELAKRCLDDPDFWPKYLLPITQRFTAIRESLGGSLYLVRGFAPVLESNDVRLREFQKAILGLVTDVSGPETLTAYLALMANGERPPMELLLPRLFALGGASHRLQPVAELRFPTSTDGSLVRPDEIEDDATADANHMLVNMRQNHYSLHLSTALTRPTYLIPTQAIGFRPWSKGGGFTVATWINIQPIARVSGAASHSSGFGAGLSERSEPSSTYSTGDKSNRSCDDKAHLLSIGSDRLMLSIYVNTHDPATLHVLMTRPDHPANERSTLPRMSRHNGDDETANTHASTPRPAAWQRSPNGRKHPHSSPFDPLGLNVLSSTAQAFQTTRIALRNSLSQFNMFVSASAAAAATASAASATSQESLRMSVWHPVELKSCRLMRGKWTHLVFSVVASDRDLTIRVTVDGVDQHDIQLPCTVVHTRDEQFTLLAIGDTHSTHLAPDMPTQSDAATSDSDHIYSLANVQLFRRCITSADILATLMALGPDASNFVPCAMGNTLPNFGYLNAQLVGSVRLSDSASCQQILRENLALFFNACVPATAIGYAGASAPGRRLACWANGRVGATASVSRPIRSLQTAIVLCGGISTLCYLFARVVELCPTAEHLQAATLAFVLRTIHTNSVLYTEFTRVDGMRLLSPVIRSERCRRGVPLLGAILDIACDQPVLTSRRTATTSTTSTTSTTATSATTTASDDERPPGIVNVNATTTACVLHAGLMVTVIRRYADWHTAQRPNGAVISTLLAVIQALVREKHPRQAINQRRLCDAGLVPALLHFCKFHLVGIESAVPLTATAAQTLVVLVSTFAGAPPAAALLDEIVKVLLLLHQPSDSFITHDRSKFYYLVTPVVLQRPRNRLSLPHLGTMRRRSPTATLAGSKAGRKPGTSVRMTGRNMSPSPREQPSNTVSAPDMSPNDRETLRVVDHNGIGHLDLSDIADCSRSGPGKWSLHEADAVAVAHQQQQRYPRAQRAAALATIGTRRRIVRRHTSTTRKRTRSKRSGRAGMVGTASSAIGTDSEETTPNGEVSESGFDETMSGLVNQYDIIAADDIAEPHRSKSMASQPSGQLLPNGRRLVGGTITNGTTRAHQQQEQQQQRTASGVRAIQVGLFGLLKDFILILPDTIIRDVLAHYVTVDVVLVLANHRDASVRAAIVRLLAVMCQRLGDTALANAQRSHSWLHVGNQMALHPVDEQLVRACCQWATGSCLSLDEMIVQPDLRIVDRVALHAVLAVLPQTAGDLMVLRPLVQLVERLYGGVATPEQRQYMVENGLVAAVAKCVQQFFQRWGSGQREFVEGVLVRVGQTVCAMAMRGLGSMNVLWDLLNVFTFFEDTQNAAVMCGVRAYQSEILNHLVLAFLPPQRLARGMSSFKFSASEVALNASALSAAEIRTRFELLIDRTVQHITTAEPQHQPTDTDLRLIHTIIHLTVGGLQRAAQLVTWSLCPARPLPLKLFTAYTLHNTLHSSTSASASAASLAMCADTKLLRCMLGALLATDYETLPAADQHVLQQLAAAIRLPQPNVVTHLSHTLEKLDAQRQSALRDRRPAIERSVHRHEPIVAACIETAMRCTRAVVELQNAERRQLINAMRCGDDATGQAADWRHLIERMTHEGAPWHSARTYPRSWRLDETAGPGRARMRLRRCHQTVATRFLMAGSTTATTTATAESSVRPTSSGGGSSVVPSAVQPPPPLHYLRESLVQRPHFPLNDRVLYTFGCRHLPVDLEHDGEMVVTESHLIFVPNVVDREPVRLALVDIAEVWPRRHQHQDTGLEFGMVSRRSVLFVFADGDEREQLVRFFADKVVQSPDDAKLSALTQHWAEGGLTNWEYLMALNQISGRTFQDLMQYPVFPWILSDYTSATLDLTDAASFRKLDRPIAVQSESSEAHYITNYTYLEQAQQEFARSSAANNLSSSSSTDGGSGSGSTVNNLMRPYHYGSHYSNSGTVLHYLVRVPPFTNYFLRYQDNNFDLPDRTFHSMHTTWRLASRDSPTDVKELIPEFFTLPEMLENFESFQFGQRQSGERVDHVALPPWSAHSARLFVLIHRQALESDAVRAELHRWIDLVFGWKQQGAPAVMAINVFHPATYIGFSAAKVTDPVEKKAFETMVRTYGQMPRQLFQQPHPAAIVPHTIFAAEGESGSNNITARVRGLRWGLFTGSPHLPAPSICKQFTITASQRQQFQLIALPHTNVCYALPAGRNLMRGSEPDTTQTIGWHEPDGIVRVRRLHDAASGESDAGAGRPLLACSASDPITACGTDAAATQLWFGHRSGRLSVHRCTDTGAGRHRPHKSTPFSDLISYNSTFRHRSRGAAVGGAETRSIGDGPPDALSAIGWHEPVVLVRHTDQVTSIALCDEFRVCVSVALDGAACIWDTNTLAYVRCIEPPSICRAGTPIRLVAVSPTLGDIVTVLALDERDKTTAATEDHDNADDGVAIQADVGLEATEEDASDATLAAAAAAATATGPNAAEDEDDVAAFVRVLPQNVAGRRSVMRLHTINARYVCHVVDAEQIECIGYSTVREGTGINVIAAGYADGTVRLWSSWDLTLVRELRAGGGIAPMMASQVAVRSVAFTTYQHLAVLQADGVISVWQSEGLGGRAPQFPRVEQGGGGGGAENQQESQTKRRSM